MNKYVLMMILSLLISAYHSQAADYKQTVREQAQVLSDAMFKKDYATVADYTLPLIYESMGGKDKMVAMMQNSPSAPQFLKIELGEVLEVKEIKGKIFCVLPQLLQMKQNDGTLTVKSHLLGVSLDQGAHWSFIDVHGLRNGGLERLLPEAAGQITLPAYEEPVLSKA